MEELRVTQDARRLFEIVIGITEMAPQNKYDLNQQIIRAAISVGSNVVEGRRRTTKEFKRFIDISIGSCDEVKYQVSLYDYCVRLPKEELVEYEEQKKETIDLCDKIIGQLINLKKALGSQLNTQSSK